MPAREKAPSAAPLKTGLQDDHDPNDIGQKQNNRDESDRRQAHSSEGKLDDDNLPDDESKFG